MKTVVIIKWNWKEIEMWLITEFGLFCEFQFSKFSDFSRYSK